MHNTGWALSFAATLVVLGCGRNGSGPSEPGYGAAKLVVPIPKLLQATIARVGAEVSAAGMDTIRKDLTIGQDAVARGVVDGILVGDNRRISLSAYGDTGVMTHTGSAGGLTIAARETLDVAIPLLPVTGAISAQGTLVQARRFALPKGATMDFVWIEPGTFLMGSPMSEVGRTDEGPMEREQHQVTITRGFWLGQFELTQGQWEAVMETAPWTGGVDVQADPRCPAVYISWNDVQRLVEQLNEFEGAAVYRLPTEAEWEYACRAGTTARWSFGDDQTRLRDYAWYGSNAQAVGERYAHAVGTKLPNPWGLYDIHGNVLEWVLDCPTNWFPPDPQTDPVNLCDVGSRRVLRGGYFYQMDMRARSAARDDGSPDEGGPGAGARLLRTE